MALSEYMALFPEMDSTSFLIGAIIGALISAFFGFRLFKISVVISLASAGFTLGYTIFYVIAPEGVDGVAFDFGLIVGLALAIVSGLIAIKLYKAMIYLVGGAWGALVGFVIPFFIFEAMELPLVGVLVGIALAVLMAILFAKGFMKLMKVLVILETALGGMALAFEAAAMLVTTDDTLVLVASAVGLFVGILAAVYQFKVNKGRALFEKD